MLVYAYTVARSLFFERLVSMSGDDFHVDSVEDASTSGISDRVITEIMLLFDCEHLTACNWRKRWLLAAVAQCAEDLDQIASTKKMLDTELSLLTTYQCSPLHRHTKSPTLWSHRLWVLRQMFQIQTWTPEALLKLHRAELDGVLRAAELHPKNYYAFGYIRQLHSLLAQTAYCSNWSEQLARPLMDPVLDWCLAHPRDISAWVFGKYLLGCIAEQQVRTDAVGRVVCFARDIGWEGESLWTFVDQAIRQFDLENVLDEILPSDTLGADQHVVPKSPWLGRLTRAQSFWAAYRNTRVEV
ncbi:Protein prenyltransferase [Penicillium verhagenii]|nr:Protein prenyltransferase [Penicillium verhagenii]